MLYPYSTNYVTDDEPEKHTVQNTQVWMKKEPHTKPENLRGGLHGSLMNSET